MKITSLNSRHFEEQRFESENINSIEQEITKSLIEKYKPKDPWNIGTKIGKDNWKRES